MTRLSTAAIRLKNEFNRSSIIFKKKKKNLEKNDFCLIQEFYILFSLTFPTDKNIFQAGVFIFSLDIKYVKKFTWELWEDRLGIPEL